MKSSLRGLVSSISSSKLLLRLEEFISWLDFDTAWAGHTTDTWTEFDSTWTGLTWTDFDANPLKLGA